MCLAAPIPSLPFCSSLVLSTMRSLLLLSAAAALALAAPDHCPKITSVGFSGSGCPSSVANAVKSLTGDLGDVANFTLSRLKGDSTDNCEIHLQASGGSSGWQVAVQSIAYSGNVQLSAGSQLDTFTQVYWTDHAADTVSLGPWRSSVARQFSFHAHVLMY